MKKLILLLGLASSLSSQDIHYFVASYSSTLAATTDTITIQAPTGMQKDVHFVSAWIYCSAACSFTINRNGAAATTTSFSPNGLNDSYAPQATAFKASNVGAGTQIGQPYQIVSAGTYSLDLSKFILTRGANSNLSISIASFTGTWIPSIQWSEQ
jgi:hypothetical protein